VFVVTTVPAVYVKVKPPPNTRLFPFAKTTVPGVFIVMFIPMRESIAPLHVILELELAPVQTIPRKPPADAQAEVVDCATFPRWYQVKAPEKVVGVLFELDMLPERYMSLSRLIVRAVRPAVCMLIGR
jgi:hypothetical protein